MSAKLDALDAKIAAQTERLRQLKEQKSKAERRARAAAQKRERQRDTRRKILLGALWMQELKNGDAAVLEKAKAKLDTFLKRDADRHSTRPSRSGRRNSGKTDRRPLASWWQECRFFQNAQIPRFKDV